ncbi:MAG TPA: hypothetical protein V6C72_08385, partial [Chroococcales cyanobacterium]
IHEQLSAREFDILLALGLAGERPRITLERFALNIRDYFGNKDNLGHSWRGQYIELGGPEALRTNVPLLELEEHLTELGFLVGVSNYAGSFVCNEVYYRAMAYQQSHARLKYVLFMHLPEPENLAKTLMQAGNSDFGTLNSEAERKQKALDIMFNAVIKTIVFLGRKVIAPDGEAFA